MDATIRPARAEDAATVAAVHNRSRAQAFRGHIADEVLNDYASLERKWAEYFDAPDGRVHLAEVDGEAVGMAYGVPGEPAFCGSRSSTSAPRCSTPSRASPSTARKRTTRVTASP